MRTGLHRWVGLPDSALRRHMTQQTAPTGITAAPCGWPRSLCRLQQRLGRVHSECRPPWPDAGVAAGFDHGAQLADDVEGEPAGASLAWSSAGTPSARWAAGWPWARQGRQMQHLIRSSPRGPQKGREELRFSQGWLSKPPMRGPSMAPAPASRHDESPYQRLVESTLTCRPLQAGAVPWHVTGPVSEDGAPAGPTQHVPVRPLSQGIACKRACTPKMRTG